MSTMNFTATGDSFVTRRLHAKDEAFQKVFEIIGKGQVRFTNLEVTTHHFEGFPSAFSGGTWAITSPDALKDLKAYGFNMMAWANNHTMDYSYGGLEATERYINEHGFIHAGVGKNRAKAGEPRYLETSAGRVALIAATSTFHESWIAGDQRPDVEGRPGVNPLRYVSTQVVSAEKLQQLKVIADTVDINAEYNLAVKEGFAVASEPGSFQFGTYRFAEGSPEGLVTEPHPKDLQRILNTISEAKRQADYVLVSIHTHEMKGEAKDQPADFIRTFAKKCIDEGAHAILGHGPHILRPIEIYKNRPIFYSLGNFIFQNDTVTHLPADYFDKYGLGHYDNVADALDVRSQNNTKGLGVNPNVWSSVIPFWSMEEGELKELTLYPIDLGFGQPRYQRGWPMLTNNTYILESIQQLSSPYGTEIVIEGNVGKVILK